MEAIEIVPALNKQKIKRIGKDPVKAAKAVDLIYVSDSQPGILRVRNEKNFDYVFNNRKIKIKKELDRIKSLVIPPAWEDVWICALANGHLQVTGKDALKRKQYRYHPAWNHLRNHTKFYKMIAFAKALPAIRLQLEKDLALPELSQRKVLAAVVSLMQRTNIRVGNSTYEKLYGSFGLTTLKDKHVAIEGSKLQFMFKGKKGVEHDVNITSKRLARIVKQCRDIPGKELFQYFDVNKERRSIDSGMVNNYIKEISGEDFTAKDFRTWAGTVNAFLAFKELGFFETEAESKKKVVEALDNVAKSLGNTRTVCKKYYVHPIIISMYEDKTLEKYLNELEKMEVNDNKADLTPEEKIVMKILEN
ncbi:DNA topoisomerase IB [Panacibacter ginsenosidivorans]|uniref:DNA topoisomerase IB n=1 Tax=Panacibacter ginsenosidivorans TaxID=1813871 RepID=A0A5B8V7C8_9BACT|nr:DNA topoisomerase IB [Panacibacter ginsenosidivorans]QEC67159.1 DNA topoisomerase IB [Panacibacter ginsenosidivorans]